MSALTMDDLAPGMRVHNPGWRTTGTLRQCGRVLEVRWDDCLAADEVSDAGPVLPEDLEIIKD